MLPVNTISAEEKNNYDKFSVDLNKYSALENPGSIEIDGKTNDLFVQFISQDEALNNLKISEKELLEKISKKYKLGELCETNWETFYNSINYYFEEENQIIDDRDYHYVLLTNFFDIYENKYKNKEILDIYESKLNKEEKNSALLELLPYDDPYVEDNSGVLYATTSYDRTAAIDYAISHAILRAGPARYYSYSQDCTNFASQILEAGGEPQDYTGDVYSGWWHTVTPGGTVSNPTYTHNNSRSFTSVGAFNSYWGTYYTTTSHSSFASYLRAGSIIACDTNGDGDLNHIGFVTEIGSYDSSLGYIDYKVAQHTSDYHRWTSSPYNKWELQSKWRIIIR